MAVINLLFAWSARRFLPDTAQQILHVRVGHGGAGSVWKPMGFMMSMRSVRIFYAIAPESSGSRWNTVRQFRILLRTPPFSVVSSTALISSMLWGGWWRSWCFLGLLRLRLQALPFAFKLYHFLSVVRNQSRSFLHVREEQHIQQIFHMVLLLQGFHKQRDERLPPGSAGHNPFSSRAAGCR